MRREWFGPNISLTHGNRQRDFPSSFTQGIDESQLRDQGRVIIDADVVSAGKHLFVSG
jgi:hypothetical protein